MRRARRALRAGERARAARLLAVALSRRRGWRSARRVAVYMAGDGEIDPAPAVRRARRAGKRIYLPVVPSRPGRLAFRPWRSGTPMRNNRFGIPEPSGRSGELGARRLDLVVVPLVACDGAGRRLGMGGGFYDRTFAHRLRHRSWRRPRLVGVGYDFQCVEEPLGERPWDVRLDDVVLIPTRNGTNEEGPWPTG